MTKNEAMKRWENMRKDIDEAIRAGLTAKEFMELNDISRDQWYRMKPKGFKWHKIQTELNIKRKLPNERKLEPTVAAEHTPKPVVSPKEEKKDSQIAVVVCKGSELKNVLGSLLN